MTLARAAEIAPDIPPLSGAIAARLQSRAGALVIDGEALRRADLVRSFYERRAFAPAWFDAGGAAAAALALRQQIADADHDGLDPADYHWNAVDRVARQSRDTPDTAACAGLEILASDAFLTFAAHLHSGRADPRSLGVDWYLSRPQADLAWILGKGLETGLAREIDALRPGHPGYDRLRHALSQYRDIERRGGWPPVPEGPTLRPGDRDPRVRVLRRRLRATEDWTGDSQSDLYDASLAAGVRVFQARHGLQADAVLGPKTLAALGVPVRRRVEQILVNLERWRWLPLDFEGRRIQVNAPAYQLSVYEDGAPVLQMPVIVGRALRSTPVLSERMTQIVFSPYWNIPKRLAVEDILPKVQQDSMYLRHHGIRVFRSWAADAPAVDPREIDWTRLHADSFPLRLRQDPGPQNLLGRVKFLFPNPQDIYLHDTPSRGLFGRNARDLSSGCVRVADPVTLALYVLRDRPEWTREAIRAAMQAPEPVEVDVRAPIRVDLLYWTAWADENGSVHFRDDIYGRDPLVLQALTASAAF